MQPLVMFSPQSFPWHLHLRLATSNRILLNKLVAAIEPGVTVVKALIVPGVVVVVAGGELVVAVVVVVYTSSAAGAASTTGTFSAAC